MVGQHEPELVEPHAPGEDDQQQPGEREQVRARSPRRARQRIRRHRGDAGHDDRLQQPADDDRVEREREHEEADVAVEDRVIDAEVGAVGPQQQEPPGVVGEHLDDDQAACGGDGGLEQPPVSPQPGERAPLRLRARRGYAGPPARGWRARSTPCRIRRRRERAASTRASSSRSGPGRPRGTTAGRCTGAPRATAAPQPSPMVPTKRSARVRGVRQSSMRGTRTMAARGGCVDRFPLSPDRQGGLARGSPHGRIPARARDRPPGPQPVSAGRRRDDRTRRGEHRAPGRPERVAGARAHLRGQRRRAAAPGRGLVVRHVAGRTASARAGAAVRGVEDPGRQPRARGRPAPRRRRVAAHDRRPAGAGRDGGDAVRRTPASAQRVRAQAAGGERGRPALGARGPRRGAVRPHVRRGRRAVLADRREPLAGGAHARRRGAPGAGRSGAARAADRDARRAWIPDRHRGGGRQTTSPHRRAGSRGSRRRATWRGRVRPTCSSASTRAAGGGC